MSTNTPSSTLTQRRFLRVPYTGAVRYRTAPKVGGLALSHDVGRGGMCLDMPRALQPGTRVMLELVGVAWSAAQSELKGEVIWCRPSWASRTYAVGVRVFHDDPEALDIMSAALYAGIAQSGLFARARAAARGEGEAASGGEVQASGCPGDEATRRPGRSAAALTARAVAGILPVASSLALAVSLENSGF